MAIEDALRKIKVNGSYHVRGNSSPDDFMSWGDYFYLEALLRMEKGIQSYWVDRK